ncbi:MAG: F-type H+-transporting ATPase subunit a [Actinomycetota bacterium]|jgi:F-type H+-transporting ATPase subunit a|nr:F-type H+-transporting ATPase subunit a [Actinomycetota bacterium]MDQ1494397.1 F-type H+-transporting ATPase subunit a [Actinomycetota bacterium]
MSLLSTAPSQVVAATIDVGTHPHAKILGLTINTDTVLTTLIAAAILVAGGFYMRFKAQSGVPSKLQLIFETIVDAVNKQVEESMGIKVAPFVVPLAVTLFCFILLCNWIGLLPSGHPEKLPAPTADINLTLALAIAVIIPLHIVSIRRRGLKQYVKHYFQPYPIMFPINLIEELVKPFTLALRLFGNLISGAIMVALLALMTPYILWVPQGAWKLIDAAVGVIQAFIFALLTILYFAFATTTEHAPEEHRSTA